MTSRNLQGPDEANCIRAQLKALEHERLRLEARLREIETEQKSPKPRPLPTLTSTPTVTNGSPAADKVNLVRKLFAGRTDVFPTRWENPKSGRSGYAPACANEWVRGVCGKPQIRCGECPNQSFIPVSDEVIEAHLRGEDRIRHNGRGDFVAGVYPLLFDDTCRFLAVDFDDESWSSDARRIPDDVPRARGACRARTLALRQWRSRVAVLRRCGPSLRGTPSRDVAADADYEPPAGDRLQVLRPTVPEPGQNA